jgi:hypothetical protein
MTATVAATWWRGNPPGKVTLTLHVQPNARCTAAAGLHGDALKLRIAAPATEVKANREVIDFLHQWFNLPLSQIHILQGSRNRRKVVELACCRADTITQLDRLEASCPAP